MSAPPSEGTSVDVQQKQLDVLFAQVNALSSALQNMGGRSFAPATPPERMTAGKGPQGSKAMSHLCNTAPNLGGLKKPHAYFRPPAGMKDPATVPVRDDSQLRTSRVLISTHKFSQAADGGEAFGHCAYCGVSVQDLLKCHVKLTDQSFPGPTTVSEGFRQTNILRSGDRDPSRVQDHMWYKIVTPGQPAEIFEGKCQTPGCNATWDSVAVCPKAPGHAE